jgi:hypothetical protein
MKNLFLLWLLIYVITGNVAFAEKAMSPVLLTPTNFAKSISKDSIKFTWQNAQNEVNAKVNGYRIIISENAQFNGYTPSTGRCNITCVTSVINSTSFTTGLRSSNKTYYWRVQGLSPTENGEWSRTGTFKTDVPVPSITNASATPSPVIQGSTLNIAATLSGILPSNYSVKLSDNGNLYAMNGSGTSYSFSQSPTIIGTRNYSVGVYDINNNLKSSLFNGSYDVKKPNTAPTLNLISGNTTATTGTNYTVQLQGNDTDNNLSQITINWGDGSSNSQNATSGSNLTFTHTYTAANIYTWSATAYDSVNASSDILAKTVSVSTPIEIPIISSASASPTSITLGNSINFSATLSSNLPNGYSLKLNYGNTSVTMSGSGTNYSVVQTPTLLGQQIFTVSVYDANNNLKGSAFTGNFQIVKANVVPTLSFISGNTTATAGTSYSVQLQASDADNNLKSITVVWGDGTTDMQNATNGNTPTFTNTYTTANTYNWSATATDSSNATSNAISKSVSVTAGNNASITNKLNDTGITTCSNATTNNLPCPVSDFPNQDAQSGRDVTNNDDSDGHAGFSFTKISSTGASLPASATSWNCVKDNVTGLMWKIKTTDGGLHDQNHTYTWYEPNNTKNGGDVGTKNGGICKESLCDTNAYVAEVNTVGYCGYKDWRLPTRQELTSIVDFGQVVPAIDTNYFQNTKSNWYWSSSLIAYYYNLAWGLDFGNISCCQDYGKNSNFFVRLVR